MQEIPSIGPGGVGPINRAAAAQPYHGSGKVPTPNGVASSDRVELSDHARLLDRLRQLPEVRTELVDRIRREIADGAYDTPEKLDGAVRELLDDVVV